MKTHIVIDEMYHEEEWQGTFVGTLEECESFLEQQGYPIGMKIVLLTPEELAIHNNGVLA